MIFYCEVENVFRSVLLYSLPYNMDLSFLKLDIIFQNIAKVTMIHLANYKQRIIGSSV